jgi:hypothetical protein
MPDAPPVTTAAIPDNFMLMFPRCSFVQPQMGGDNKAVYTMEKRRLGVALGRNVVMIATRSEADLGKGAATE